MTDRVLPGGIVRRAAAFGIDYLVIVAWLLVVVGGGALLRAAAPDAAESLFGNPLTAELVGFATVTLPVSLYFILGETAPAGATWGKRRLWLRVVTPDGQRLPLARSVLRTAAKFLPWELAHAAIWRFAFPASAPGGVPEAAIVLVWVLVAANLVSALMDDRRRTLYDRISRTIVIRAADSVQE